MLTYKYKLCIIKHGTEKKTCSNFESFRFPSKMLCLIKNSTKLKLYSIKGEYICKNREYPPVYTKSIIANSELFLYHMSKILYVENNVGYDKNKSGWYTDFFLYADKEDSIWNNLKSVKFCKEIFPLLNVNSIDELKDRIKSFSPDNYEDARFQTGKIPLEPLDYFEFDEIGTLP